MKVNIRQTEKLLKSEQKFSQLGFSMMLTRLKTRYTKDSSSLQHCMDEINKFLSAWTGIMTADYAIIEKM